MRLDYFEPTDFMTTLIDRCVAGDSGYACSTDVHQCIRVYEDEDFRENVVNSADYVITDSFYMNKARRLLFKVPETELMTAAVMMPELCRRAEAKGVFIALIGGKDEAVLQALCANLTAMFPNLQVAYSFSPPFRAMSEEEDAKLVEELARSGAKLIFVGLGCPKQEKWMAAHKERVNAMMIGVGAAFDFNAGVVRPSPRWVHRFGLEWAYRIAKEPRRLFKRYFTTAPKFAFLVARDAVTGHRT